jgi:hypothetical protein
MPKPSFLEWLTGFAEADGSWQVHTRGTCAFIITQNSSDRQVLDYIRINLGFGSVIKQGKSTHRFVVQDKRGLVLLTHLFNGNVVLITRKTTFLHFLDGVNNYISRGNTSFNRIIPYHRTVFPRLNDAWLSGFTDGEGCFTVSIVKNCKAFTIIFILSQKWDANKIILEHIASLFGFRSGCVVKHSEPYVWEIRVNGVNNCRIIFDYFSKYPLRSQKIDSYHIFIELQMRLSNKEHLKGPVLRLELHNLALQMNKKGVRIDDIISEERV